jgi:hypothetical protein
MAFLRSLLFVVLAVSADDVARVEQRWDDALLRGDKATLAAVLAEDFVFIDASGARFTRQQILDSAGKSGKKKMTANHTENRSVRTYGETAVVTGRFVEEGTYDGKPYSIATEYTDVYVRRGGVWRAVAAHASARRITLDGKPYEEPKP